MIIAMLMVEMTWKSSLVYPNNTINTPAAAIQALKRPWIENTFLISVIGLNGFV